jgi:ketosteroid isomerase-like protein
MQEHLDDFRRFMLQREEVARAYVRGDAAPLDQIVTHEFHATFFGPQGGFEGGAQDVAKAYRSGAKAFEPGGDSKLELLQIAAGAEIAYWVGIQRAQMRMRGQKKVVPIALRVTEVFRREGGSWKLVHRHADALAEPQPDTRREGPRREPESAAEIAPE